MSTTHVDLAFPVRGTTVPRDHAYALYGALSRAQPDLHGQAWLGVHSIPGRLKDGDLDLSTGSYLRLRIPTDGSRRSCRWPARRSRSTADR
jgi:CRISPR-associated protein Cas6